MPIKSLVEAEAWIFDLDNTLYPASSNLFDQVDQRITGYIAEYLNLGREEARRLQKTYFREHGTTLSGLMSQHGMDPLPFLDYVHDIDVSPVPPSPALDRALGRLGGRKVIFTNGSTEHARRVTDRLGVTHHFEAVFDIVEANYIPKPEPRVYGVLVDLHGLDPRTTVMVEDIARNLEPAAALGMTTVWVETDSHWGREGADGGHVHHVTDDLVAWLEQVVAGDA